MVCNRCPKECKYYEMLLKKKCFRKLKNNVWERKTKWTLLKRADRQYEAKILRKCLNSWLAYLNGRYKKKITRRLAELHYEAKLKSKVIIAMKKRIAQNSAMMKFCRKTFEWNLKYKSWHQWKHYAEKRLKVKEVKLLANRIREERMRTRFLYLWLFRMREKRSLEDAYTEAIVKHEFKLQKKYFKAWKFTTRKLIWKMKIQKLAVACYEDKLREKTFRQWKNHTFQRKRYKYQMNLTHHFYENFLIKNYISLWASAFKKLKLKKRLFNNKLAVEFYDRKLLLRSFQILWNVRERKRVLEDKAEKFRKDYVKIFLNFWMEKRREKIVWNHLEVKAKRWRKGYLLETFLLKLWERLRELMDEREEMANVDKYYRAVALQKAFLEWRELVVRRVNKKTCLEGAYKLYLGKLTQKTFQKWRKFIEYRSVKKMAIEYSRLMTMSKVLEQWKILLKERRIKLAGAENLERKRCLLTMRHAFDCWNTERKISKSKLIAAIYFCDKLKLSRTFTAWRKVTRVKAINRTRYNRNKTLLDVIIIKNMIFRWYEMNSAKQNLKKKLLELRMKQEKRSLRRHFGFWQSYLEKVKSIQQNAERYPQIKTNVFIEEYLLILLEAVRNKQILNEKEKLAKAVEKKLLKRRYLRKWVAFVYWKRERILRCLVEERKLNSQKAFDVFIPPAHGRRRKPMIPSYLKINDNFSQVEGQLLVDCSVAGQQFKTV